MASGKAHRPSTPCLYHKNESRAEINALTQTFEIAEARWQRAAALAVNGLVAATSVLSFEDTGAREADRDITPVVTKMERRTAAMEAAPQSGIDTRRGAAGLTVVDGNAQKERGDVTVWSSRARAVRGVNRRTFIIKRPKRRTIPKSAKFI
ncbi:hypothetical protein C8R45DRAFT_927920 [Mycena sanguinolenta]|nr:hypothetical protein C8R45DRAFT_927920 [Mycena sanguinolenta]